MTLSGDAEGISGAGGRYPVVTDRGTGSYTVRVRPGKCFGWFPRHFGSDEVPQRFSRWCRGNFGPGYLRQTGISVRVRIRHPVFWVLPIAGVSMMFVNGSGM